MCRACVSAPLILMTIGVARKHFSSTEPTCGREVCEISASALPFSLYLIFTADVVMNSLAVCVHVCVERTAVLLQQQSDGTHRTAKGGAHLTPKPTVYISYIYIHPSICGTFALFPPSPFVPVAFSCQMCLFLF